ncbi:MAG: GNAT family protein [Armatimonadota bacterium]
MESRHIIGEAFGVRTAPLTPDLAVDFAANTSVLDFRYYTSAPENFNEEGWVKFINARNSPDAHGYPSFGHALYIGEELAGMSTVFDVQSANHKVEIGYTMLFSKWRGTALNPAAKLILMRGLFEDWGCYRVQLKGDARNAPSMRAMLNMGFCLEGTLRSFQVLEDDYRRDVTFYSVVQQEWPKVKAHLEELCRQRGLKLKSD